MKIDNDDAHMYIGRVLCNNSEHDISKKNYTMAVK